MDIQDKFLRAKLATLLVGTSMLQYLFGKRMDNFMFQRRLKEIGIIKFKPPLWNFLNLYNLCTRGVIKELEPTEGWMACTFNPRDVSLGDDIKRLHGLLEKIKALETDMHEYKSYHEDICRILTDIIKRFSGSEDRDFTNVFRNIMFQGDRDEIVSDLDTILNKDGKLSEIKVIVPAVVVYFFQVSQYMKYTQPNIRIYSIKTILTNTYILGYFFLKNYVVICCTKNSPIF